MTEPTQPKSYDQLMDEIRTWQDMEERAAAAASALPAAPVKHKRKLRIRVNWRKVRVLGGGIFAVMNLFLFSYAGVLAVIGDLTVSSLFFGMVGLFNMSHWGRDGQPRH